jgi:hypothetical protein
MNVEIGTETAHFQEKEYRNGIFVAVVPHRSDFVRDGRAVPPAFSLPHWLAVALTGAAQLRGDGISSCCCIINVNNHPSWATSGKEGMAWYSSKPTSSIWGWGSFNFRKVQYSCWSTWRWGGSYCSCCPLLCVSPVWILPAILQVLYIGRGERRFS